MKGNLNNGPEVPKGARLAFGILMIFIYLGMGLLLIFGVIPMIDGVVGYVIGGLLMVYGAFRAYRLFKGYN